MRGYSYRNCRPCILFPVSALVRAVRRLQLVHTTVVGNYPRIGDTPDEQSLRRAIARFDKGEISAEDLREAERDVVKAVLREQNDARVEIVTDGQISRYDTPSHIARRHPSVKTDGHTP